MRKSPNYHKYKSVQLPGIPESADGRINAHMFHKLARPADIDQPREPNLGNNSTELPASSGDTMGRRPIPSWEGFTGDDESSRVGAKVLEEVGKAVQEDERLLGSSGGIQGVISKAYQMKSAVVSNDR